MLAATKDEDQSQTENPIRKVTDGLQQEIHVKPDIDGERERKEDAIDAQDEDAKLIETRQSSIDASQDKVSILSEPFAL